MIERLRHRLWLIKSSLSRLLRKNAHRPDITVPVKGNIRNVIVVKPQNGIFSEAMFVLRDDYMRSQNYTSAELIRQAREAAGEYSASFLPPAQNGGTLWVTALVLLVLGVAALSVYLICV